MVNTARPGPALAQHAPFICEQLVEWMTEAVVIVDDSTTIVLVNRSAEAMFGYSRDELLGCPIGTLIPERLREQVIEWGRSHAVVSRVRHAGPRLDLWGLRNDAIEFPVEVALRPIRARRGLLVAAIVRDMGSKRAGHDSALAALSHDLRNPLSTMIGFAALLHAGQAGPLSGVQAEYVAQILASSRHLLRVVVERLDRNTRP